MPAANPAIILLGAVRELHSRGYERLRIRAGLAPSGHWRCSITGPDPNVDAFSYSTGAGYQFFGFTDSATAADERVLADQFVQRFPALAASGKGQDKPYVQWFLELLEIVTAGSPSPHLPIEYADMQFPKDVVSFTNTTTTLPLPPGR